MRLELDHIGTPSFQGDVPEWGTVLLFRWTNIKAIFIRLDKPLVFRGNLNKLLLRGVPSPHVILLCERPVVIQSLLSLFIGWFRPLRFHFLDWALLAWFCNRCSFGSWRRMRSLQLLQSLLPGRAVGTLDKGTLVLVATRSIKFPRERFLMLLYQPLRKFSDHVFPLCGGIGSGMPRVMRPSLTLAHLVLLVDWRLNERGLAWLSEKSLTLFCRAETRCMKSLSKSILARSRMIYRLLMSANLSEFQDSWCRSHTSRPT